jgi:amino acid transporter
MINYSEFKNVADPLAFVFEKIDLKKIGFIVSISAVVATTSVLIVFQIGQPRIWMSMSRDGLLPKAFSRIHPKFQTPSFATVMTGLLVAIPALFIDIGIVTDLTSIGTLFAFVLVCAGVLNLPKTETLQTSKKFRLPYINGQWIVSGLFIVFIYGYWGRTKEAITNISNVPHQEILFLIFVIISTGITITTFVKKLSVIPILGMLFCLYLMIEIPAASWLVFFGWMTLGLTIYFSYGYKRSKLS